MCGEYTIDPLVLSEVIELWKRGVTEMVAGIYLVNNARATTTVSAYKTIAIVYLGYLGMCNIIC